MRRDQSGQASVEVIWCAALLALTALVVLELLCVVRARITAERVADQAAVLIGEGRPVPDALRRQARIDHHGDRLAVTVMLPVRLPGLPDHEVVTTTVPE